MNSEELSTVLKDFLGFSLKKGEVLVVSPTKQVSSEQLKNLSDALGPAFAKTGNTLIILPPGLRVEHVSKGDLEKILNAK